jgi:hypothetical protein
VRKSIASFAAGHNTGAVPVLDIKILVHERENWDGEIAEVHGVHDADGGFAALIDSKVHGLREQLEMIELVVGAEQAAACSVG